MLECYSVGYMALPLFGKIRLTSAVILLSNVITKYVHLFKC